ncbi:hypothetical protein GQ53DRAFT_891054 [Thozetella sp. PMI_491]|nr:hypothetical protein GQ53DRAFT_891054 [Thozetella sp. PMI_491]
MATSAVAQSLLIAPRRRKVRRGTSSCWECRHSKIKCVYDKTSSVCNACRQRRQICNSQMLYDDPLSEQLGTQKRQLRDRLDRLETLVSHLTGQPNAPPDGGREDEPTSPLAPAHTTPPSPHIDHPSQTISFSSVASVGTRSRSGSTAMPPRGLETFQGNGDSPALAATPGTATRLLSSGGGQTPSPDLEGFHTLSSQLFELMPSSKTSLAIIKRAEHLSLPLRQLLRPYGESAVHDAVPRPTDSMLPTAHPVFLAHRLIHLAVCIQQVARGSGREKSQAVQTARSAARRYFEMATAYVTSHDGMMASLPGLETLMLEGLFHVIGGNLYRGWLTFRRAIGIGQLLGLDSATGNTCPASAFTWFRLLYGDRFLSLVLGLPCAPVDDNYARDEAMEADVPLGRLERLHAVVMGRITKRNQRLHLDGPPGDLALCRDVDETRAADQRLARAMGLFPPRWWLLPELGSAEPRSADTQEDQSGAFGEISRLLTQANHHHIVLLLHFPYALRALAMPRIGPALDLTPHALAAVTSSRAFLSRFTLYRKTQQVPLPCRAIDYKALTAALLLLIAHIDSRQLGCAGALVHQRLQDVAMVRITADSIENLCSDAELQTEPSARLLRRMLEIEADSAAGVEYRIEITGPSPGAVCCPLIDDGTEFAFMAPYFGSVRLTQRNSVPNPSMIAHAVETVSSNACMASISSLSDLAYGAVETFHEPSCTQWPRSQRFTGSRLDTPNPAD